MITNLHIWLFQILAQGGSAVVPPHIWEEIIDAKLMKFDEKHGWLPTEKGHQYIKELFNSAKGEDL